MDVGDEVKGLIERGEDEMTIREFLSKIALEEGSEDESVSDYIQTVWRSA